MEADVPARSTNKVHLPPHTPAGDFTGGVLICKSAARCTADTVLVLRRGFTAATGNQNANSMGG
jgi:hypothetical protein